MQCYHNSYCVFNVNINIMELNNTDVNSAEEVQLEVTSQLTCVQFSKIPRIVNETKIFIVNH